MENLKIFDSSTGEILNRNGYKIVKSYKAEGDYYKHHSIYSHDEMIENKITLSLLLNILTKYMRRQTNIVCFDNKRISKKDIQKILGINSNTLYQMFHREIINMTIIKIDSISYMINPLYITKCIGLERDKLIKKYNELFAKSIKTKAQKRILEQRKQAKQRKLEKIARSKLHIVKFE